MPRSTTQTKVLDPVGHREVLDEAARPGDRPLLSWITTDGTIDDSSPLGRLEPDELVAIHAAAATGDDEALTAAQLAVEVRIGPDAATAAGNALIALGVQAYVQSLQLAEQGRANEAALFGPGIEHEGTAG